MGSRISGSRKYAAKKKTGSDGNGTDFVSYRGRVQVDQVSLPNAGFSEKAMLLSTNYDAEMSFTPRDEPHMGQWQHANAFTRSGNGSLTRILEQALPAPGGVFLSAHAPPPQRSRKLDKSKLALLARMEPGKKMPVPTSVAVDSFETTQPDRQMRVSSPAAIDSTEKDPLLKLYPTEEFDITFFAHLERLRPGQRLSLGNFVQKPEWNGLTGSCTHCDATFAVWTIQLDCGKRVRVLPLHWQTVLLANLWPIVGSCVFDIYVVDILAHPWQSKRSRKVRIHVPPESPVVQSVENVANAEDRFEYKPQTPELVVDLLARRPANKLTSDGSDEAQPRSLQVGDTVTMHSLPQIGIGRITDFGDTRSVVHVTFGDRGHSYKFSYSELVRYERQPKHVLGSMMRRQDPQRDDPLKKLLPLMR